MTETFDAFTRRVPSFATLSPTEKICHAAWYLHSVQGREFVTAGAINSLFDEIHSLPPHTAVYLKRLAEKKPPLFIKTKQGFRLENRPRRELEEKFAAKPETAVVSALLTGLLGKVGEGDEARFLDETLRCYSVRAFRAAIVMAWNLAFDHIIRWVVSDAARLSAANNSISVKYAKKNVIISDADDFADLKEFEVIEVLRHAGLITKNIADLLKEKLRRRNAAAHPSSVVITQAQADDVLTDLVNNIVLRLK
jgi:hypothetical protein